MLYTLRKIARNTIDSFFQKNLPGKETIGGPNDFWTVLTGSFSSKVIYSGGVGKDIGFELKMIERFGCDVFCFDPSPTGIDTIRSLSHPPPQLHFFPYGLSNEDHPAVLFSLPLNPFEGSFSIPQSYKSPEKEVTFECKKVSTLMRELGHTQLDILKIDIEGFEYGVIEDVLSNKLNIDQICVEFHDFYDNIPRSRTRETISKLKRNGYALVHKTGSDYLFVKM